ncbi:MAG: hypothetical protein IKQ46_17415 [Bacteroidales bacterium]|nr:hypothetical protein [Bacteroidales bacterium]
MFNTLKLIGDFIMGKAGKVLKPKQNTGKHHKHVAAYEIEEKATSMANQEEKTSQKKAK